MLLQALLAVIVVQRGSTAAWGDFLVIALPLQLATTVCGWGSRDFLQREFAKQPARRWEIAGRYLAIRLLLVLACGLILSFLRVAPIALLWTWLGCGVFLSWVDAQWTYDRKVVPPLLVDLVATGLLVISVLIWRLGGSELALAFAGTLALRAVGHAVLSSYLARSVFWLRPARAGFLLALPTQAVGLLGLLNSRVDQYAVAALAGSEQLAGHQILMSALLLALALPGFLGAPLVRSVVRLSGQTVKRLVRRFLVVGVVGGVIIWMLLPGVLRLLFGIDLSDLQRLLGAVFVFSGLISMPVYWRCLALSLDRLILIVGCLGLVASSTIAVLGVPRYGVEAALAAAVTGQLVQLVALQLGLLARE